MLEMSFDPAFGSFSQSESFSKNTKYSFSLVVPGDRFSDFAVRLISF